MERAAALVRSVLGLPIFGVWAQSGGRVDDVLIIDGLKMYSSVAAVGNRANKVGRKFLLNRQSPLRAGFVFPLSVLCAW